MSIYVFYGEEEYLLENTVNKIKKDFGEKIDGINYIQIGEENINNLLSEIQTPAFGYPKKLIIVKKTNILKTDTKKKNPDLVKIQEKLYELLQNEYSDVELIFIEDKLGKTKLLELLTQKKSTIIEFKKLDMNTLIKRLKNICNQYKVNVNELTLGRLIEISGTSLQILINEIRKLIEYVGPNGTITVEIVEELAIKNIDSVIFDLTDYLGAKNIKEALIVYKELIYQGEPLQKTIVTLYRHFKKLYMVKLAIEHNKDIISILELKSYQNFLVEKYKKQAKVFSEKELREKLKKFAILDQKSKVGLINLEIGFETLLCT